MDRIHKKNQARIYNFLYVSLVFILVYQFGLGIGLKLNLYLQLILVLFISMLVKFFLLNPFILYILSIIGLIGGLIINHYLNPFIMPLYESLYSLFQNIINNFMGKENINTDNLLLYWSLLIILVSLYNAYILFKNKSIYLLLPVYIAAFLYYWYTFYDQAYWLISSFFIGFIFLMGLNRFLKEVPKFENQIHNISSFYELWLQTAVKYGIIIVLLALVLPKNNNYIRWSWLQDKVVTHFPFVEELRSYDANQRDRGQASLFNFSMTGSTTSSSRLGGPVNLSDKKIMTVFSSEGNYLRGNVQHIYNGSQWQRVRKSPTYHSLRENFSSWSKEDIESYYSYVNLTIHYNDFASTTLFSPYKPAYVNSDIGSKILLKQDDLLELPQGIYDGESYSIGVQKPHPYEVLLSSGVNFWKVDIDNLEIYLQVPEDKITERTRALVTGIVKDLEDDYDKTLAIETYLRKNYSYNLYPEPVPHNVDFVDYFLFESQEGYCTYYATAMAIMLRLEGIPSRYVEGYLALVPSGNGVYEVRENNTHTWVEAFIEPLGWLQFEPTPAYPTIARTELNQSEDKGETNDEETNTDREPSQNNLDDMPEISDDSDLGFNSDFIDYNKSSRKEIITKVITLLLIGFILILPIRYIIGFLKLTSREKKVKKSSPVKRVVYLYDQTVSLMGLIGHPQESGETHYEYADRIGYKFYDPSKKNLKSFMDITDIFVRNKYGNDTRDDDIVILEEYRRNIENRVKNTMGRLRFYYRKYLK